MKSTLGGYVPGGETCAATGKKRWLSRRDARTVAKRVNPGEHMSAFRCASCGDWHLGHIPTDIVRGAYGRDEIRARGDA